MRHGITQKQDHTGAEAARWRFKGPGTIKRNKDPVDLRLKRVKHHCISKKGRALRA
jgi:hypothetical protein